MFGLIAGWFARDAFEAAATALPGNVTKPVRTGMRALKASAKQISSSRSFAELVAGRLEWVCSHGVYCSAVKDESNYWFNCSEKPDGW